jgi:hypothetical protein
VFKPFVSLTTRIKEIAPRVSMALNRADYRSHKIISEANKAIEPFANSIKKLKRKSSDEEWAVIKSEILNGNWAALEARGVEGIPELRNMFTQTAKALGIPSIENYFRRRVVDLDGLTEFLGKKPRGNFKRALDKRRAELRRELTRAEKSTVIRNELRTREGSGLGKQRSIETVTPEMSQFYEDPLFELGNYIRQSAQAIARREMLGIETDVSEDIDTDEQKVLDNDISNIIAEMAEEGMSSKDEKELTGLLKSALEYKRAPKWIEGWRRLASAKYVTRVKTTVKQWGDMFVSVAENGFYNVITNKAEAKNWSDEFGKEVELSLEEQGIEKLDAELQATKRSALEDALFKPLQSQDLLGKRVLMRSTARKWRRLAKSNPAKLKKQLMEKFRVEGFVDNIINDMSNGTLSSDVSFALYSQMADFHPISHSQHIRFYIDRPYLRPLFILKSFAFKRFDRLYREGFSQIVDGLAKSRAAAIDGDVYMRRDAADQIASGVMGVVRFMVFAVGGEMLVEKAYKEAMQKLGFAPEEIPEDESWASMYMQELSKIAPFIDPYSLEKAIERGDPMVYLNEAHDAPAPLGSDAIADLIKHMRGDKDVNINKWKKDIPWMGEFLWGAEQESREWQLMRKRVSQERRKRK